MTVAARADPSLYVVSSQPAVINPVVHCLYFLPGPQLFPSHRASTTLNAWIITPPRHTMSDIYLSIYTSYYRWQPAHIMTSHCNLRTCLVTRCKCWDEPQSIDISDQWMVTVEDALTLYSKSEHDQTTSVFKLTTLMTETDKTTRRSDAVQQLTSQIGRTIGTAYVRQVSCVGQLSSLSSRTMEAIAGMQYTT